MLVHKLRFAACCILLAFFVTSLPVYARQQPDAPARGKTRTANKLPSPDKIIGDYIRAIGGKRRVGAVRDAVYEWEVEKINDKGVSGRGSLETKAPASTHWKFSYDAPDDYTGLMTGAAATPRSAWMLAKSKRIDAEANARVPSSTTTPYSELTTFIGKEASEARLQAAVFAGRLMNYKKQNMLARTADAESVNGEAAYAVEISTRDGARARLSFSRTTKLLLQIAIQGDEQKAVTSLSDYKNQDGILEPHRISFTVDGEEAMRLRLREVKRNTGIADAAFDPPGESAIDVPALLREVARNQSILDERVSEYTFTRKQTEREINDRGEVKKEKIVVHEVYPVSGGGRVLKLISEDGVALAGDKLAREERRVVEEIGKIERENVRAAAKRDKSKAKRAAQGESGAGENGDDDLGVAAFLRACEFVAPRRERFRERDAIVFDFRPRAGFKPSNNSESLVAKLAGIVWIDPVDKQVVRLEARLTDGFKIGGGLVARVRSGSAFVIEQTRLADGVWLPRFSQINASAKVFLLAGFRLDATREYGDYKRFSTEAKDYELKEQ